jgi:prepilin-type N-terminal cleavage/methylation domain-containing protein
MSSRLRTPGHRVPGKRDICNRLDICLRSCTVDGKGYTLIELLVVIAILSILAGLTLASSLVYQKKAYNIQAEGDARSVYIASHTYFGEHPKASISSVDILTPYGLIKTSDVNVTVSGTVETLSIAAYHNLGNRTFTINNEGAISW